MKQRIFTAVVLSSSFLLTPLTTNAFGPIVTCGFDGTPCTACHFFALISHALVALVALTSLIIILAIMWAGVRIATAAGNVGTIKEARSMLTNSIVGLLIILCSWLIINTVMHYFVKDDAFGGRPWNTISADECRPPEGSVQPTPPTSPGGGETTPPTSGGSAGAKIVAFAQASDAKNCQYNQDRRNGCTGNPGYTDCSNLVETAYKNAGCRSPGSTTMGMYPNASPDISNLRMGDALVYEKPGHRGSWGHVVICMQDGCSSVIQAAGTAQGITVGNSSTYLNKAGVRSIRVTKWCSQ